MCHVVGYLFFQNTIQLLACENNKTRRFKYLVSLYIHSSLKCHSSILNTALKHHTSCFHNKADYYKFELFVADIDLCFIVLLFSSQFFDFTFSLLYKQWMQRCSKTSNGGVSFVIDMLSTAESLNGMITKCGFANHASRIQLILHCMLSDVFYSSFFLFFLQDHWRDFCKLEEYHDYLDHCKDFPKFLSLCWERKHNK